jgi:carbon monoxide dehydrogenase subunit G
MDISGSYTLNAPAELVWPRIFDPNSLISLIPGCQQLVQVAPDEYRGQMNVGVAAVSGKYDTFVRITEADAPNFCSFKGQVTGPTGTISGTASFSLKQSDADTEIEYHAQGLITGALGTISPRILESIAKTFINQALGKLNKKFIVEV